jgi:hypothetical protein
MVIGGKARNVVGEFQCVENGFWIKSRRLFL